MVEDSEVIKITNIFCIGWRCALTPTHIIGSVKHAGHTFAGSHKPNNECNLRIATYKFEP